MYAVFKILDCIHLQSFFFILEITKWIKTHLGELTLNWVQVWKSSLDVCVSRVVFSSLDIKVTVMTTVSLGCRRLAQNLVSAPASITAGMATRYCLQTQTDERLKHWQRRKPQTSTRANFNYKCYTQSHKANKFYFSL